MRLKVAAVVLAAALATTQVTGCSSTGSGGSSRDYWIDPEIVVTPGIFVDRVVEVSDPAYESELIAAGVSYP